MGSVALWLQSDTTSRHERSVNGLYLSIVSPPRGPENVARSLNVRLPPPHMQSRLTFGFAPPQHF